MGAETVMGLGGWKRGGTGVLEIQFGRSILGDAGGALDFCPWWDWWSQGTQVLWQAGGFFFFVGVL